MLANKGKKNNIQWVNKRWLSSQLHGQGKVRTKVKGERKGGEGGKKSTGNVVSHETPN